LCHAPSEHGTLFDATRNADKVPMYGEIDLLNEYEKTTFVEKQVADNEKSNDLGTTIETILWKKTNNKLDTDNDNLLIFHIQCICTIDDRSHESLQLLTLRP